MIFLLLGWNLTLLGVVTVLLGAMTDSFATAMIGVFFGVLGLGMSLALRNTCSSYRSDAPEEPDPKRPLDHYV